MFDKLRNRFLILNMTIITVVMIIAFFTIYFITYTNIQTENNDKLQETTLRLPPMILKDTVVGVQTFQQMPSNASSFFSLEIDPNGEIIGHSSNTEISDEMYQTAVNEVNSNAKDSGVIMMEGIKWQYSKKSAERTMFISKNGISDKTVLGEGNYQIAFLDITDSTKTLSDLLVTFLIVGFIMLFVIFLISLFFANKAIKPIAQAFTRQKQFIADASHELKTPLAYISANSDAMLANEDETIKSQKKWLCNIKSETQRMGKLVGDLLYLARTDDSFVLQMQPFDISETVNEGITSIETTLYEKSVTLHQHIEPEIIINGDSEKIRQVILILLDNAVKYSNENGEIEISLKNSKNQIAFTVRNTGNGIKSTDLTKIFDRFYRVDSTREHDSDSYGLGLPIAKAIMDRMGGKIFVQSTENEYAMFTVLFNK